MKDQSAPLPKLYSLPLKTRLRTIQEYVGLEAEALKGFQPEGGLTAELADHMIENVVGTYALPLGVAVNFQIK